MSNKFTHDELMQKIELLEQEKLSLHNELKKVQELKDKFQMIADHAIDSIFCKDLNRKYTYINPSMAELLGCNATDLIGKAPEEIFGEEEATIINDVDQRNLRGENVSVIRALTIEGRKYTFHTMQTPIRDKDEKIIGITGIVRDISDQKMAEDALEESERKLRKTLHYLDEGYFCVTLNGVILDHNQSFNRILGFDDNHDLKGQKSPGFWSNPDDRTKYLDELMLKGSVKNYQVSAKNTNNEDIFILLNAHIVNDKDNKPVKVEGTVTDLTEMKRAEKALAEKDAMLRNIASQVPGMLYQFMMAPDGSYSVPYSSESVKNIFGCSPEDVRNDFAPIFNAIYPEDRDKVLRTIDESVKNMTQWMCEYRVQLPGKPVKWVLGNSIPEKRNDGSIVWSGYNVEITRLKQAENGLSESEEQFRQFFEHLTIGVAVYDAVDDGEDFVFLDINPAGQRLSKVSVDEIRGVRLTQVFPGVRDLGLFKALQDTWRTGKSCHVPIRQYKDKRITQWVENTVFKLPSGKVVAVYDDRTEVMRLEEGIRQAQKMEAIGTLAGGIAHDFNNILSVLTGNISYALSILNKDDELFEVLSDVMQGTEQAHRLTNQLLTFSKGGEPIKKSCDINNLLEDSAKFVTSGSKSRCDFKLAGDLWPAEIDSGQIHQVISNLVINADQSMPNGGSISIRTENIELKADNIFQLHSGKYIKITVEDQGVGIHEKHLSSIFEPYFTTKHKGSGLGLATAYSIVKRHAGHITVYSELGTGTVFNIYLPASLNILTETGNKAEPNHQGRGRILIMDDQAFILKTIERLLKRMGYETKAVTDGTKVIDLYREAYEAGRPFDLVILDLTVPGGMGGAKTIPELLKIDPKVKAVVSSGYSNDPIMANFQDYGFCGVVPKPYMREHLSELLNKILGEKK